VDKRVHYKQLETDLNGYMC